MIDGETRFRVYNKTRFDIGVVTANGVSLNIAPDSFKILTANDILYIDSICNKKKFFSTGMLVPVDNTGKNADISEIGLYVDDDAAHLTKEDIVAAIKQSVKKFEAWLSDIDDDVELHSIYMIAKEMDDLPMSKLKILKAKMPNNDWLDEME